MEVLFKKYFWLIRVVGIGIAVAFAGSAVATLIGAVVVLDEDAAATIKKDDEVEGETDGETDGDEDDEDDKSKPGTAGFNAGDAKPNKKDRSKVTEAIVKANPFCPSCKPEPEIATPEPGSTDGPAAPGERKSSLPLQLLATMESDDPRYSMATIKDTETGTLGAYGVRDSVRDRVLIASISRGKVVLRNGRNLEYIKMGDDAPPPPPKKEEKKEEKKDDKAKKNPRAIEGADDAIKCSDENHCTVERKWLEGVLANPAQLTKQARVVPAIKDGETRGFKFYGIRPGSLPKLIGLKNGDLLLSVNGNDLTSLDQAMGLYTKLRRASNLEVVIERKGQEVTKEIEVK